MDGDLRDGFVDVGRGVRLHFVELGSGPLVVLLHGFPEFWFSWRHQLRPLAEAGFRVVAPDLRGYNLSDKPRGVAAYALPVLARDVAELIVGLGEERAALVGHDWGGGVAWACAMQYPERLARLVILNAPHPGTFVRALGTARQLRKSWYIFFFQLPWLPEALLRANDFRWLRRQLAEPEYVAALRVPGALSAAINYYRAMFRDGPAALRWLRRPVRVPVLVIWGQGDPFLGPELAEMDRRLVPNGRVERIADAGHWVQLERPGRVNELLIGFLRGA